MKKKEVNLYTDGGCSPNPGPGGWGVVLLFGEHKKLLAGYEKDTTNNRMEITAVIEGLLALKYPCIVHIYTDSQYVKNAFTEHWLESWQQTQWKKGTVKNQDLWMKLLELANIHHLHWNWVRGHSGSKWNEMCDALTHEARKVKGRIERMMA